MLYYKCSELIYSNFVSGRDRNLQSVDTFFRCDVFIFHVYGNLECIHISNVLFRFSYRYSPVSLSESWQMSAIGCLGNCEAEIQVR